MTKCTAAEYAVEMQAVDDALRARNVLIPGRELQGIREICRRNIFSLGLHEPLALRMRDWFRDRYGDRLKMDMSLGYCPVYIRGDAFKLRIPMMFGGGWVVCICPPTPVLDGRPVVNVLELIEGLPQPLACDLKSSELKTLEQVFRTNKEHFEVIGKVRNAKGFSAAFGDLSAATDYLCQERFEVGLSRWASLQLVEKFFKAWLEEASVSPPKIHDLSKLAKLAESNGLVRVDRSDLDLVQCEASVRYDPSGLNVSDAVAAYHAALRLAAHIVASRLGGRTS